jgi:predicted SnoaL-like aldol condensation-catalyzing enzyme
MYSVTVRSYRQISMKLEFSRQIFVKYWNTTFHEKPSSGSRVVPYGRTDTHDEADGRFSQFCERA